MKLTCARRNSPNDTTFMVILNIPHKMAKVNIFLFILLNLYILYITNNNFLYHSFYELSLIKQRAVEFGRIEQIPAAQGCTSIARAALNKPEKDKKYIQYIIKQGYNPRHCLRIIAFSVYFVVRSALNEAVRFDILFCARIVRSFLRDKDIMRMTLDETRIRYSDEPCLCLKLLDIMTAAVAHT